VLFVIYIASSLSLCAWASPRHKVLTAIRGHCLDRQCITLHGGHQRANKVLIIITRPISKADLLKRCCRRWKPWICWISMLLLRVRESDIVYHVDRKVMRYNKECTTRESPVRLGKVAMDEAVKQTQDFHPGRRCLCRMWNQKANIGLFHNVVPFLTWRYVKEAKGTVFIYFHLSWLSHYIALILFQHKPPSVSYKTVLLVMNVRVYFRSLWEIPLSL